MIHQILSQFRQFVNDAKLRLLPHRTRPEHVDPDHTDNDGVMIGDSVIMIRDNDFSSDF